MAFSLSNWFKSKSSTTESDSETPSPSPAAVAAPAPPPSVRTVTPSASPNGQQAPVSLRQPVALTATKLPVSGKVTPVLPASRKVSFAPGTAVTATPEPAAPSLAPAPAFVPPAPDVIVSLEVGDFLDRLPATFAQSGAFDRSRKVEFQASELYSDLSKGRASVPASVIYKHCPELFSRPVTETEDVEVPLPLRKLVEQMGTALSTRHDQVEEENVGEIETPFLQVAMEDNARLPTAAGSTNGAVRPVTPLKPAATEPAEGIVPTRPHRTGQISSISPVKAAELPPLAPPTAATASPIIAGKRPPSTVRASVAGGKIRLSGPAAVTRIAPVTPEAPASKPSTHSQRITLPIQPPTGPAASPSHQVTKKTARIQIPPISLRAGGPNAAPKPGAVSAPPTAPAAGNQPVPTPVHVGKTTPSIRPGVGREGAPTISFRTSPPPPSAKPIPATFAPPRAPAFPPPAFPASAPAMPAPAAVTPPAVDDRKIELGLAAILRSLPSAMLSVEPSAVPDDARLTLPFALIEPQLSQGRVSIGREMFLQALPDGHREVLAADADLIEIPLPLQEVFQNLPASALSIRQDQVTEETGVYYPTPFSQKADEDAARFGLPKASSDAGTAATEAKADEPASRETAPAAEAQTEAPADAMPASSIEEAPARDIPLDEEAVTVEDKTSTPPETAEEKAVETPVESRDIDLGTVHEEAPIPETPVAAPEPVAPPAAEPVVAQAPPAPVAEVAAPEPPAPVKPRPAAVPVRSAAHDGALQTLFMTEEEMDAKTIVKLVCQLPAVTGCAVMFEDGLRLAGNFPANNTEGFSAMAAPFYKRAMRFISELELGTLQAFTLNTENGLLSFFMHDNICVSVHHTGRGFMPGVREKLEVVTRELARMYTTAKPADADPSA